MQVSNHDSTPVIEHSSHVRKNRAFVRPLLPNTPNNASHESNILTIQLLQQCKNQVRGTCIILPTCYNNSTVLKLHMLQTFLLLKQSKYAYCLLHDQYITIVVQFFLPKKRELSPKKEITKQQFGE
ncbi:hypothetical protein QL285_021901 [Trifolium repens]|nr:hypothetical protein QL285_021901 [Trifolium repens]